MQRKNCIQFIGFPSLQAHLLDDANLAILFSLVLINTTTSTQMCTQKGTPSKIDNVS